MSHGSRTLLALAVHHVARERDLSMDGIAAQMGLPPSGLSDLLAGRITLTNGDVRRLAAALGMAPEALVDRAAELNLRSLRGGLGRCPPARQWSPSAGLLAVLEAVAHGRAEGDAGVAPR